MFVLAGTILGCVFFAAPADEVCSTAKVRSELDQVEGIQMLQVRGDKVFGPPSKSCLEYFTETKPSMLETSETEIQADVAYRQIVASLIGKIAEEKRAAGDKSEISMLDVPCGENLNWMPLAWKDSELRRKGTVLRYRGSDTFDLYIERNQEDLMSGELFRRAGNISKSSMKASFESWDETEDPRVAYDLVFMRVVFGDIKHTLQKVQKSGSRYFLTLTDPTAKHQEKEEGRFYWGRTVNLEISPYNLGGLVCSDLHHSNNTRRALALFDLKKVSF